MTLEDLDGLCRERGFDLDDNKKSQLKTYMDLLLEWNEKFNLTAITDPNEILEKHFYDSVIPLNSNITGKVADVGTGAGFPGIVWKIVNNDLDVSLIEPTGKRCKFLDEVIHRLGLDHIQVFNVRSEDHAKEFREYYDVVTARAVANLPILAELCVPLVKKNGLFIAMKGSSGMIEHRNATHARQVLGIRLENALETVLPGGDGRCVLYYRKHVATDKKFPRNFGQIRKKPL